MPKDLERKLKKSAKKKGLKGKRAKAYVYGTMNKIEKAMEKPHKSKTMKKARARMGEGKYT